MATIDSTSLLVSLLCFIVVLTLSVNVVAGPDGTSSVLPSSSQDPPSESSSMTISGHPYNDVANDKKIPKMMAEGGPILIPTSTQQENRTAIELDVPNEPRVKENTPKARYAGPSIVPRKGVEGKVKPRKGVDQSSPDPEQVTASTSQTPLENIKPIMESSLSTFSSTSMAPALASELPGTSKVDTQKLNANNLRPNDKLDHYCANSSLVPISGNVTTLHTTSMNVTMQNSSLSSEKKHIPKPKPTVTTIGKSENNESRLPLRNKSSPLGASRKIDYIVPIMITIIALPLLGAAIFVLYRRGRDCWDKRHYRRMDFLIDGMYND